MTRVLRPLFLLLLLILPIEAVLAEEGYLQPADVPLERLLAPPPQPDSAAQQNDMQAVLAAQAARSEARVAQAKADAERSVLRFADALEPGADEAGRQALAQALPLTRALFKRVGKDTESLAGETKRIYERPRPFVANPEVRTLTPPAPGSAPTPSYPSSHATYGATMAILLAEMVPEHRAALFARGIDYAQSRLVLGMHYPTDLEAGRISGTVIANALLHDPRFLEDFAAAKQELRQALHLP